MEEMKKFNVFEMKIVFDCKKKKKTIFGIPTLPLDDLRVIYK
jgi:hypothetical protein